MNGFGQQQIGVGGRDREQQRGERQSAQCEQPSPAAPDSGGGTDAKTVGRPQRGGSADAEALGRSESGGSADAKGVMRELESCVLSGPEGSLGAHWCKDAVRDVGAVLGHLFVYPFLLHLRLELGGPGPGDGGRGVAAK